MTGGMNWHAEYVGRLSRRTARVWTFRVGPSVEKPFRGATYEDARLKLGGRAPSTARASTAQAVRDDRGAGSRSTWRRPNCKKEASPNIICTSCPERATLANNETKAASAFYNRNGVALGFGSSRYDGFRWTRITSRSGWSSRTTPRPGWACRSRKGPSARFQRDTDGSLELVGEDRIQHTPARPRPFRVSVGGAFDIAAERKQTDFRPGREGGQRGLLRDHADQPPQGRQRDVTVIEHAEGGLGNLEIHGAASQEGTREPSSS